MAPRHRVIRNREDVTDAHVAEALDMRDGLYGGTPLSWPDVIDRLETGDDDWGTSMDSPAIRELKRRVRRSVAQDGDSS